MRVIRSISGGGIESQGRVSEDAFSAAAAAPIIGTPGDLRGLRSATSAQRVT
jgi:hypothetical protein